MNIQSLTIGWEFSGTLHMPGGLVMNVPLSCVIVPDVEQSFIIDQIYVTWTGPDGFSDPVSPTTTEAFPVTRIYDPCTHNTAYALDSLEAVQAKAAPQCCFTDGDGIYATKFPG